MNRKLHMLLILSALFLLFTAARAQADTTVMIYMCGSNLETLNGSATDDLLEIRSSGFDPDEVHVLVLLGGSRYLQMGYDPANLHLLEITPRQIKPLGTLDPVSMGDPMPLQYLLDYGYEHFPADRYGLILWDHGGGPLEGLCLDELFSPDTLTLSELAQALETSMLGREKLEWIGFDACLMSSVEVALRLSPYARYMIASEENEPDTGWNYAFIQGLPEDASGADTGKRIVRSYIDTPADEPRTLSVLQMDRMEPLMDSFDRFFEGLQGTLSRETYSDVALLRKSMQSYGPDVSRKMSDHDLVDLWTLTRELTASESGHAELSRALEEAVIYRDATSDGCMGLSVYFPYYNKERYTEAWKDRYDEMDTGASYREYVSAFGRILTGAELAAWDDLPLEIYTAATQQEIPWSTNSTEIHSSLGRSRADDSGMISVLEDRDMVEDGLLIRTRLSPEQQRAFASARLVVMERLHTLLSARSQYRMVYTSPVLSLDPDGYVRAPYTEQTLSVLNGDGKALALEISYTTLDSGTLSIPVIARTAYDPEQADELNLVMTFRETEDGLQRTGTYVLDPLSGTYTRRISFDPDTYPYLAFRSRYMQPVRDGSNRITGWEETEDYLRETVISAREDWHPAFRTLSGANALVMYLEITDTQNTPHVSDIRTLSWGYSAPDLLADSGIARILLENMQLSESRLDLSLTFLTADEAGMDLVLTDFEINGQKTAAAPDGERYVIFPLKETSADTRVLSLALPDGQPLRSVSFRFMARYDGAAEEADSLENGNAYVDLAGTSPGLNWHVSDLARICLPVPQEPAQMPSVLSPADFSIQPGRWNLYDPVHSLESIAPLTPDVSGSLSDAFLTLPVPENAAGFNRAVLLTGQGSEEDGALVIRVHQTAESPDGHTGTVSFRFDSMDLYVQDLPVLRESGVFVPLHLSSPLGTDHVLSDLDLSSARLRSLLWNSGDYPVALSDTYSAETLIVRIRKGSQLEMARTSENRAVSSLPLVLSCRAPENVYVLFLDAQGRVLDLTAADPGEITYAPRETASYTRVDRLSPDDQAHFVQEGPFIARIHSAFDVSLVRCTSRETEIHVPETVAGQRLTGIGAMAFAHELSELYLPRDIRNVHEQAFTPTYLGSVMEPFHQTLHLQRLPESAESLVEVHEAWKFERVSLPGQESLYLPPLICVRQENSWEVLSCSPFSETVQVPAMIEQLPVTSIHEKAFCRNFIRYARFVHLPDTLRSIGDEAFLDSSLTEINLPESLESIGQNAFAGCGMLRHVLAECSPALIREDTFSTCPLLLGNPAGLTLADSVSPEENRRLSLLMQLDGGLTFATVSQEAPPPVPADSSAYLGTWYGHEYTSEGKTFQIVTFSVTFYDNKTYNGTGVFMAPMNGTWTSRGQALDTEDGTFMLLPSGDLIMYMNHASVLARREPAPSPLTKRPEIQNGLWYGVSMTENGTVWSAMELNLKLLLEIRPDSTYRLWGLSDGLLAGTLTPADYGYAADLFDLIAEDGSLMLPVDTQEFRFSHVPESVRWEDWDGRFTGTPVGTWKAFASLTMGMFAPSSVSPFPLDCEILEDGTYRIAGAAGVLNSGTWTDGPDGLMFSNAAVIPMDSRLLAVETPSSILFFTPPESD